MRTTQSAGEGRLGALPACLQAPSPGARDGDKGTDDALSHSSLRAMTTLQDEEGLQTEGGCG